MLVADPSGRLSLEIDTVENHGELVPVTVQDVLQIPFCALTRLSRSDRRNLAQVLVVAPLSAKQLGAQAAVVMATEPWFAMTNHKGFAFDFPIAEYERAAAEHAEQNLTRVRAEAQKNGLACETVHVNDFPAEAMLAAAKAKQCDLVMASHGRRGVGRLLLGSQAARVATRSTLPVLVCRCMVQT